MGMPDAVGRTCREWRDDDIFADKTLNIHRVIIDSAALPSSGCYWELCALILCLRWLQAEGFMPIVS